MFKRIKLAALILAMFSAYVAIMSLADLSGVIQAGRR